MKKEKILKTVIYIYSSIPLFFGLAWIYIFGFTDYRSQQSFIGILIGLLMLFLAIGMIKLNQLTISISVILTFFIIFFISIILIHNFNIHLFGIFTLGLTYIYFSLDYLFLLKRQNRRSKAKIVYDKILKNLRFKDKYE